MVLLMFITTGPASAVVLTLEECTDLALKNNSGLKAVSMDKESSGENVSIAQKEFLPSLKLNGNYVLVDKPPRLIVPQNSFSNGIPPLNSEISLEDTNWYGLNLSLQQPIFTGGKLIHSYLKAKALNEESQYKLGRKKRELVLDVRQSFFAALNARLYTELVDKALESKRERLRVLQELEKEGYSGREEILQQETDIQFSDLELFKGKNREALALSRLRQLIQASDREELSLQGTPANNVLTATLDQMKEAAVSNREDLKAAWARSKAADEDVAITKSDFYPHVSLQGNYLQQKNTNITRPQVWMLTAQLEWSLFEWGKTRDELRQKAALREKVNCENDELKKDILQEVENCWRTVKEQEKTIKAMEQRVRTSEYRLAVMTDKYSEEKVKLAEVIAMEAEFIKDFNEYSMAINDLSGEMAQLEASTSSVLDSWLKSEEYYYPDFDTHSKRLHELMKKKKKTNAESKTDEKAVKKSLPEPAKGNVKETTAVKVPAVSMRTAQQRTLACSPVEVQVAAFKARKQAELYGRSLAGTSGGRDVRIVNEGGFYKVRLTGLCAGAAEEKLRSAGISDYLIIKASHGYRQAGP